MKKYKNIFIILLVILIFLLIITVFKNQIFTFIGEKEYENKYNNINWIEKTLSFNTTTNMLEENNITIDNFKVILSDLNYNQNEKNWTLI